MFQKIHSGIKQLRDHPVARRGLLAILAPLTVVGLAICICMGPAPADESVYMLIDSQDIYTVTAQSDLDYQSDVLYTGKNSAGAVDTQLILPQGQEVLVSSAQTTTSAASKSSSDGVQLLAASVDGEDQQTAETTVTTRHETVANLLRRSKIKVSDGEMVVVDLSSGTPTITVCRQYTRLRYVPVETSFLEERVANPLMAKGTEEIVTPGVPYSMGPLPYLPADMLPAAVQRVGLHHRPPAAAVGIVVHLHLLIGGIVPDLVGIEPDIAPVPGPTYDGLAHHGLDGVGKQGHDVNSHR